MTAIRLRHLVRIGPRPELAHLMAEDAEITFAPMDALADGLGGLDTALTRPVSGVASGSYNFFAEGDLLLAKVTPCFENGKKALAEGLANGVGFATSEVHVIRPDARRIDPRYLLYVLSAEDFRAAGMASMTGAGGLRRVSEAAVLDYRPRVTDLPTQRAIADFLDRETARIDQLIEKKQRLVEILEEKRGAESHWAVTRGVRPYTSFSRTGIDWIPEAPSHWRVQRMASLFHESKEAGEIGLPVLSVSINWGISDRELGDEDRHRIVNHIEDMTAYKRVRPGDLVYNMMRAWQGAFGVATVDGLVSPAYVVARPITDIDSQYFEPLLRSPLCVEEFRRASKGIADFRQRLYWEHFRQLQVAVPPLEEQLEIAAEISDISRKIDRVIEPVEISTQKLREFRSALITAAVTGQIDVATWDRRGEADRRLERIEEEMSAESGGREIAASA